MILADVDAGSPLRGGFMLDPDRGGNMSEQEPLIMYSDYVCPFCYLGRTALARYLSAREEPLPIEWHPFDLRSHKRGPDGEIDHSVPDGKDDRYFEQVRQNVARLKREYNAQEMLELEELPDEVDSFEAQIASRFVQREFPDAWPEFDERVFRALWVDGRDIGDPEVLATIAESVDLDGAEIRKALQTEERRDEVQRLFGEAQESGISGVPTFVYGEYAARGAVPPAQLRRLVEGD